MAGMLYHAGVDIGSTTVKLVVLDEDGKLVFSDYRRHFAHTQETLAQLLREAEQRLGNVGLRLKITGSGVGSIHESTENPRRSPASRDIGAPSPTQFLKPQKGFRLCYFAGRKPFWNAK